MKLDITKDNVWYFKTFVGKNILHSLSKQLIENILESWGRNTTTIKTDRRIAITRITNALIPIKYGMKVSKHCDSKSYAKYVMTFVVHFFFLVSFLLLVLLVWSLCEYDQCDYNIKSRVMQGRLTSNKIKRNYELIYECHIWRTTRCDKDKCIDYVSSL